jgi:hypothetical protein
VLYHSARQNFPPGPFGVLASRHKPVIFLGNSPAGAPQTVLPFGNAGHKMFLSDESRPGSFNSAAWLRTPGCLGSFPRLISHDRMHRIIPMAMIVGRQPFHG